jgi:hypothetical protein
MALRNVKRVRLDVEQTGSGDPLILVHGIWGEMTRTTSRG